MPVTNVTQAQPGDLFVDFATELTPRIAAALAAAGVKGVMQYTPYDNTNRFKFGSAAEAKIAHDHGMYYMLNWEIQADRALGGYPVGRSDGGRNRAALRSIGYPEQVSAPVSVDMNTLYGNIDAVAGFVRGHFETDGDLADIDFSYLDTDGGRALADRGIDVRIWIPGAFGWSPELYSVRKDRAELMRRANANPQAMCIQFPSEDFQGLLRIDRNIVLKPFNVWCAPYETGTSRPDVIVPPIVIPTPKPDPVPQEDDDMPKMFVLDSPSLGSCLLTVRDDGTRRTEGFNVPSERDAWVAAQVPVVTFMADADYQRWTAADDPTFVATGELHEVEFPKPATYTLTATLTPEVG